jgi:hypothetical protein
MIQKLPVPPRKGTEKHVLETFKLYYEDISLKKRRK